MLSDSLTDCTHLRDSRHTLKTMPKKSPSPQSSERCCQWWFWGVQGLRSSLKGWNRWRRLHIRALAPKPIPNTCACSCCVRLNSVVRLLDVCLDSAWLADCWHAVDSVPICFINGYQPAATNASKLCAGGMSFYSHRHGHSKPAWRRFATWQMATLTNMAKLLQRLVTIM